MERLISGNVFLLWKNIHFVFVTFSDNLFAFSHKFTLSGLQFISRSTSLLSKFSKKLYNVVMLLSCIRNVLIISVNHCAYPITISQQQHKQEVILIQFTCSVHSPVTLLFFNCLLGLCTKSS